MNAITGLTRRHAMFAMMATGAAASAATGAESKSAGGLPSAKPEEIGIDPKRLQVAYDLMEKWTTGLNAAVPGGTILVGRSGKAVPPRFFGKQGPEPDAEPIRRDGMFYMASVTKPVIYIAAMKLVERGQLNLSDRVTRYIPEYKGKDKSETQVLHFFTHSCGLPDELPDNAELRRQHVPFSKFVQRAIETDLLFKPGTQFSYSSLGTVLTAEIVQRLSGLSIREFVKREILDPLGLKSTGLGSQGFDRARIVRTIVPDYQKDTASNWNSVYWREMGFPAGGLLSTPEDYAVICALFLNGGQWNGVRLLSPATVRMMTSNRYDDMPEMPEPVRRTQPWGLGWRLNHLGMADNWGDLLSRRVFGHTGSTGNLVWMDPDTNGFCVMLSTYLRSRAPWRLVHLSNIIASAFV